ncbi:LuxR C-terminal-related transcriptional regulator [Mycolicibacterium litorale]|uniref:Helix-turn-helix transcriptional regulator n=1 Tax=Mycolicibacterium litorale TaxID=758802 RepID=A0AAD1MTK1_9MYCO|nr:LuxR C-terminal-related transcriptional regulator [Mycolicibacterium litorale]MCV7414504.1 response regulator transcription factor [Mycolicibacterium litorale]TDY01490.1 LuxR family transcriptional regulator [Mycolicibacterium litorale]BBY15297.1 helix-turn-helix transcriptional regulator [Mycolicibacterium litorale]
MNTITDAQTGLLASARAAHARRDWHGAYADFVRANTIAALHTDDLDALSVAAWRIGEAKEAVRIAERVFAQLVRSDPNAAARKAVELALAWLTRGDLNIAAGWMNRARRLLDGVPENSTHGYLTYLDAVVAVLSDDFDTLGRLVGELRAMSGRLDVPALTALAMVAEAIEAVYAGRMAYAGGLLDEVMLPLLADDVPIDWAGDIYCIVLHVCHKVADLPRMRAWVHSMERWCATAGSDTYGGVCDVHRLQVRAATDDYATLENELAVASQMLESVNSWAAGEGFYQLGEVRRLRGDADGALTAYARARASGVDPQPGEALLRCSRGESQAAWTALHVALTGAGRLDRMRLLRAAVEIALARGQFDDAERYCRELEEGAARFGTAGFRGWAAHARGAVDVRQGRYAEALERLAAALREYRTQQSRYEAAEVYEWMALAHRASGDEAAAAADSATAESIYAQLGVESTAMCGNPSPGGLTKRELDILRRIAADGASNRQLAQQMFISEKTVGRHLANIYLKLQVSSRAAAVAWAHQHNIV